MEILLYVLLYGVFLMLAVFLQTLVQKTAYK